jgi:hypothetical protein
VANVCEAAPPQGPNQIYRFDAVAGTAPTYAAALAELTKEGKYPKDTQHRQVKYLNNVVEADHGKLKQPIRPVRGFKTLRTANATIKGFEVRRALCKGQAAILVPPAMFTVRRASSSAPTALVLSHWPKPCGSLMSGSSSKRPGPENPNRGCHAALSSVCNSATRKWLSSGRTMLP